MTFRRSFAFLLLPAFLAMHAAFAVEQATYNSAGALTSLISDGQEFPLDGELVATFEGGARATLQPHDQHSPISGDGPQRQWKGLATFPNQGQARFSAQWTEDAQGIHLSSTVTSGSDDASTRGPLDVEAVDYTLDLPRSAFAGWSLNGSPLPQHKPADPLFVRTHTAALELVSADQAWKLTFSFDQPRDVSVADVWENNARVYRVRIQVGRGLWKVGESWPFALHAQLTGHASALPVQLQLSPSAPRHPYSGFGGNFCFGNRTPSADFLLEHLQQSWARLEFKAELWRAQRSSPGPELLRDFELMQRVQKKGCPWILSVWRLPEIFYVDPHQRPPSTFARQIAQDRWPDFLDLLTSYLEYLKSHYGAEPDAFSFNESDLGVNVGLTPQTHRDAIKRIGEHLQNHGFKTKLLLGDTANPRDSHLFTLPTARDADTLRHVAALSVHSWGNGTSAQYQAWSDLAEWLQLPLIVAEAGVDPGSYRNRMFDSYAYGLREVRQFHELLHHAHPAALVFWELTDDYGLLHSSADGTPQPTPRYWLIEQFATLTPHPSLTAAVSSDQDEVAATAFTKDGATTIQIINQGATREAHLTGLPSGAYRQFVTTEASGHQDAGPVDVSNFPLPARSVVTLVPSL